ncbi:MAG: phosphate butyryltransferase [Clostridiales bacterium]|nr:phosphate butyryltransferase [Clostridiales bacterium]
MLKSFEEIKARLGGYEQKKRIGVVCAQNEHTLDAVMLAARENLVEPVLIGKKGEIERLLSNMGDKPGDIEIIDLDEPEACAAEAARLVREGRLDCIIKGNIETGVMMKVLVSREQGIRESKTLSHISFFESPYYHKMFAMTDGALLVYPTVEQKRDAIENAVRAFHKLGIEEPKVAVLAAVEHVNPKMKETVEAAELKKMWEEGAFSRCIVEGPISYDLAMQKDAAEIKKFDSPVAGDADILVVPDIATGNILLKALSGTGGAKFAGTIIGAQVPVIVTSRSMPMRDKYLSIVLTAVIGKM